MRTPTIVIDRSNLDEGVSLISSMRSRVVLSEREQQVLDSLQRTLEIVEENLDLGIPTTLTAQTRRCVARSCG